VYIAIYLYIEYCNARQRQQEPCSVNGRRSSTLCRWWYFAGFVASTVGATLSKEHAVTVVSVCLVYDLCVRQRLRPSRLLALHKVWLHVSVYFGIFSYTLLDKMLHNIIKERWWAGDPRPSHNFFLGGWFDFSLTSLSFLLFFLLSFLFTDFSLPFLFRSCPYG